MSSIHTLTASDFTADRVWQDRTARLIEAGARRLFGPFRLLFPSDGTIIENTVDRVGDIEIRRSGPGWALETCVKGDFMSARDNGMQRLVTAVSGRNAAWTRLRTVRPLMQTREAPNRWRMRAPLSAVEPSVIATAPRRGKLRLVQSPPETQAVMRVRGLPTTGSIADADADLRQALAGSDWITAGETVVRLYRPPTLFAFLGGFEIAVRVAAQGGGRHTGGDLGTPAMPQGPGRA